MDVFDAIFYSILENSSNSLSVRDAASLAHAIQDALIARNCSAEQGGVSEQDDIRLALCVAIENEELTDAERNLARRAYAEIKRQQAIIEGYQKEIRGLIEAIRKEGTAW